ncbi:hypothetical protein LTR84_004206 [Exophiala bonariae]|uniref:Uncharacterized protein n=1 Tax=Exophiala bonariae TaxID=1690606 RepID=A0AAV9N8F8_9EURO|nr:hypothetical protein LTR84_004206 [Exophiala bonariae]
MPLTELSPNKRKADHFEKKHRYVSDTASTHSLGSSAVQGMLRNTTETGDTGLFAVRPPRIPRSGSRLQSTRQRSGSFDTSFASQLRHQKSPRTKRSHRHYGPRQAASLSAFSGCDTPYSNAASFHQGMRSRRAAPRYRSQALAGLTSPGGRLHHLQTHRSLVTLRSHRDFHSLHSGSPMVYSAHASRPGHRGSSPALSEAQYGYGLRYGYPRVGSALTVASSPATMYPGQSGLRGYHPDVNNSISSFSRLPSPAVSSMNVASMNGYPMNRTTTPLSNSLQNARGVWNNSATSMRILPQSPTGSIGPHYYDYTESFLEEDCFSPMGEEPNSNPPFNMDEAILGDEPVPERRQAQSPFGTLPGSTFKPSELPTSHNRWVSELSKHGYAGIIPRRVSSLAATRTPVPSTKGSSRRGQSLRHAVAGPLEDDHARDNKDNHRTSSASRRTCGSAHSSAFFVNASRSPRDLTTLAARVHSPILDRRNYAASISGLVDHNDNLEFDTSVKPSFEDLQSEWTLPSFSFRPLSFSSYTGKLGDRPKTSGDIPTGEPSEILSPMPERPMSSQSRKRFSRILEIEDDYHSSEAKMTHQSLPGQTFRKLTAVEEQVDQQAPERSEVCSGDPDHPDSTPYSRNIHSQNDAIARSSSVVGYARAKITIHEKSTVESLLDRHIECLGLDESYSPFEVDDGPGRTVPDRGTRSTFGLISIPPSATSQIRMRPSTSSSQQHTSLASSERRRLMPRRLFASMDARLPPGAILGDFPGSVSQISSGTSRNYLRSSGWQTLPSTVGHTSEESTKSCSLTSGDMGDLDSDPPPRRFKVNRRSGLTISPSMPSELSRVTEVDSDTGDKNVSHRRSKSDILARQVSHQRRRMRILLKTQHKVAMADQVMQVRESLRRSEDIPEPLGPDESWTTEESQIEPHIVSPVLGYAELSAESIAANPATDTTLPSVLLSSSYPTRWASVIAAMPQPVKKGIELVRKASARTVRSHKSNTSIIEPMNSTRQNTLMPHLGSVPQLAAPEFGPPLTSSELNLALKFPGLPAPMRPPLHKVQSFLSDNSSSLLPGSAVKRRFDIHSLRSGVTRSSGVLRHRQPQVHSHGEGLKPSQSWQLKGQKSFEYPQSSGGDTIAMSDFQYRKRKVLERLKDWWKRQCMKRTLAILKKKHGNSVRHGPYM